MKSYKDYDWMYHQYIELDKRISDISAEFGYPKTTVTRWLDRLEIKKSYEDAFKRERKYTDNCLQCGEVFTVRPSLRRIGQGLFCGCACSSAYQYSRGKGKKINEGLTNFSKTPQGKQFFIEKGKRTSNMLARGHKTSIESALEGELISRGIDFESQKPYKLGIADVFIEPNIYLFADGDYWHGRNAVQGICEPTEKQAKQIAKDRRQTSYLTSKGNVVFRFWESEINTDVEACIDVVLAEINELETA